MVLILKEFIRTERMRELTAYLSTMKRTIPYSMPQDIFLYAKSDQLFVRDMENLGNTMEADTFKKITADFFTFKRSEYFFNGTSSDMVIEQSFMKCSRMQGGFVYGRSTKEKILTKFVVGLLSARHF
ncbi:hypothetical protein AVEN_212439-1 [Araneus ventricosus]|uniref:Uncharacterized protein n=1 Tax=Araneus ventricosus TaxID=182803 RepID=A0A4Y2SNZ1_ARAVE|nr:hypothetical protein AVEN_212439-1 [Araneus ventricosus]